MKPTIKRYPKLGKKFLDVPTTSGPVERVFSTNS